MHRSTCETNVHDSKTRNSSTFKRKTFSFYPSARRRFFKLTMRKESESESERKVRMIDTCARCLIAYLVETSISSSSSSFFAVLSDFIDSFAIVRSKGFFLSSQQKKRKEKEKKRKEKRITNKRSTDKRKKRTIQSNRSIK